MLGNVVMGKAQMEQSVSPDGTTTAPKTGRGLFTNEPDWITGKIVQQNEKSKESTDNEKGGSKEDQILCIFTVSRKVYVYPKLIDSSS